MFRQLNFKFYRQATNKINGISGEAAMRSVELFAREVLPAFGAGA